MNGEEDNRQLREPEREKITITQNTITQRNSNNSLLERSHFPKTLLKSFDIFDTIVSDVEMH